MSSEIATGGGQKEDANDKDDQNKKRSAPVSSTAEPSPKRMDHKLQLFLEWDEYDSATDESILHSIQLTDESLLGEDPTAEQNEVDEWNSRCFQLCLKQADTKLASLSFQWWEQSRYASLMNFNQMSKSIFS